ncbi:Acyl carrier protein [Micromonospora pattaloongensis]|uniref:Acyl carrier protein n=1 Tax=Micromonospora pattaloongensis TaxID=405436 RepID=A0A1H3R1Y8_9ACTN|nr:acyl carrier protein [Micromonospora pattaloongensis]SDZ19834.1 Acyl carrier protein [Micromonospora pattaloongensis]
MRDPHATVEHQVRVVIADLLNHPVETVDQDAGLSDLSGLDSLTLFQILDAVEKKFAISLDESELYGASSLSDLTKLVEVALTDKTLAAGDTSGIATKSPTATTGDGHERQ